MQIKGRKICHLQKITVLIFSWHAFDLQLLGRKAAYDCNSKLQILYKGQFLRLSLIINFVLNVAVFCTSNLTHQYSFTTVGHHWQLQSEDPTTCWQTCTEMPCCPGLQLQSDFDWWVNTCEIGCSSFDHY